MSCSLYVNYAAGQWYSAQTFASGIMTEVCFQICECFANIISGFPCQSSPELSGVNRRGLSGGRPTLLAGNIFGKGSLLSVSVLCDGESQSTPNAWLY